VLRPSPGHPGASSSPPLAADAAAHTGTWPSCGHRAATATAAPATADTADATRPAAPAGITGSGAVRASSTVKNTRTCSARPANRRSHPRTVAAARPSIAAILRCPSPAAAASSAAPITAAASARRSRHHAGSSTCVARHPRHRDLRGTSTSSGPSAVRTLRSRPFPHPPSTPPHDGHGSSPHDSCRSTSSRSPFTVSTTPPRVTQRPSPGFAKRSRGGPRHNRPAHRASPPPRPQPVSPDHPPAAASTPRPPATSARCRRRRALTPAPASPRHIGIPNAAKSPPRRNPARRSTFRQAGDKADEARALNGLGEALLGDGQPHLARAEHVTALALARRTCDKDQQARARYGLGHVCLAGGNLTQARRQWQYALSLYTQLGTPESAQVRESIRNLDQATVIPHE